MTAVELRRVDPTRNMHRFYRLDIEADLFGGFLLLKQWGRIGTGGRVVAEHFESEALAAVALQKQAARKKRRGYATQSHDFPSSTHSELIGFCKVNP